jgi:anaphase-promoting complex subunit 4
MDILSCTLLVGNKILLLVMEELELFRAFSGWLRHEIDRFVSTGNDDLTDKEANMDHAKVLAYIQQHMQKSPLAPFLGPLDKTILERDEKAAESGSSLMELLDKQLKKQDAREEGNAAFCHIDFLCSRLTHRAETVFKGIADAEKRSVRFGQPIKIQLRRRVCKIDSCMASLVAKDAQVGVAFVAILQEDTDDSVLLFRTETQIVNGISGTVTARATAIAFEQAKVLDVKFLHEHLLLVLVSYQGKLRSSQLTPLAALCLHGEQERCNWSVSRISQASWASSNIRT